MWNEPDLASFWSGSVADYARLLKVGYLAARQADSLAQILFGGLANDSGHLGYYDEVLDIYDGDTLTLPMAISTTFWLLTTIFMPGVPGITFSGPKNTQQARWSR